MVRCVTVLQRAPVARTDSWSVTPIRGLSTRSARPAGALADLPRPPEVAEVDKQPAPARVVAKGDDEVAVGGPRVQALLTAAAKSIFTSLPVILSHGVGVARGGPEAPRPRRASPPDGRPTGGGGCPDDDLLPLGGDLRNDLGWTWPR
jgi:hypothetical protein